MSAPDGRSPWDSSTLAVVVALCAVKPLVHLAVVNRYGYPGAELYFLERGRHLAFAYVDPAFAEAGTEFDILILGERLRAVILADAAWDAKNERLRA